MGEFLPDADVARFVKEEFGDAQLGDKRLNKRLQTVAANLARDPSWSIPHANGTWSATKAAYRFCANESVNRENVLEPHIQATTRRIGENGVVLVVSDTMFLNYTHHPATEGLGKIGSRSQPNKLQGVGVHSCLALTLATHRVLGVVDQQVIIRHGYQAANETDHARRKRKRESEKWLKGVRHVTERVVSADHLIFVFDREGDIFEAVEELQDRGARFVIRATHNRRIETEDGRRAYFMDAIRSEPIIAKKTVTIPAGGGRKERTAEVSIRAATYSIMPPVDRQRSGSSRDVNIVWVMEEFPPKGVEPLEWTLATGERIKTEEDVLAVVDHYCGRWKIEEWHKGLKTGCRIEARELEAWDRLEVLLGIFSVIAWRLLLLRDVARTDGVLRENEHLSERQCVILRELDPSLHGKDDARSYLRSIAKLGGFLGRKRDGDPGWITLWRGFSRLRDIETGYTLSRKGQRCG